MCIPELTVLCVTVCPWIGEAVSHSHSLMLGTVMSRLVVWKLMRLTFCMGKYFAKSGKIKEIEHASKSSPAAN